MVTEKINFDAIRFPNPAARALLSEGLDNFEKIAECRKKASDIHGFGPKALQILKELLAERGQSFLK